VRDIQKLVAELLGTFTLVFVGSLSILAARQLDEPKQVAVAFGFGLALLAGLYAFGEVSGGHFNPSVSLGMLISGRLSLEDLISYWAVQVTGAILASLAVLAAFSRDEVALTTTTPVSVWDGLWIELLLTAVFVFVVLQSSRSERVRGTALLAIPLALVALHLAAIPFTGASFNTARTLGPALVGNKWTDIWIYFVAPLLGGAIAALIHAFLYGREKVEVVEVVEVTKVTEV
jgi:aquaporin Z